MQKRENSIKKYLPSKKIAHSFFENMVHKAEYKYLVQKLEDGLFLFFAYSEDDIFNKLRSIGINAQNINNIYFAQNEFNLTNPITVEDRYALIKVDDIISIIPLGYVKDSTEINLDEIELSKHKISIKKYDSYGLKASYIYTIAFIYFLYSILSFAENSVYKMNIENIEKSKLKILRDSNLPTTQIQLNAIGKNLEKLYANKEALKQKIKYIFQIARNKNHYISSFEITKKSIIVVFATNNIPFLQEEIDKYFKNEHKSINGKIIKLVVKR